MSSFPSVLSNAAHRLVRSAGRRWTALILITLSMWALAAQPSQAAEPVEDRWLPDAPTSSPGWKADFVDNFKAPLNTEVWGRYHGGAAVGTVSDYRRENAGVDMTQQIGDGVLKLSTLGTDGSWTSAGMSSGRGFAAVQGKWVVKAKFDRAPGVGYAFLLYPKGGGWPPEVDILEGVMGNTQSMATLHYGANNTQVQRWLKNVDMTKWHTYGVIMDGDVTIFTLDGTEWARIDNAGTPKIPMWFGMQAGIKSCQNAIGECFSAATPESAHINVDWVAHYAKV